MRPMTGWPQRWDQHGESTLRPAVPSCQEPPARWRAVAGVLIARNEPGEHRARGYARVGDQRLWLCAGEHRTARESSAEEQPQDRGRAFARGARAVLKSSRNTAGARPRARDRRGETVGARASPRGDCWWAGAESNCHSRKTRVLQTLGLTTCPTDPRCRARGRVRRGRSPVCQMLPRLSDRAADESPAAVPGSGWASRRTHRSRLAPRPRGRCRGRSR
jgi:hypothetical protein